MIIREDVKYMGLHSHLNKTKLDPREVRVTHLKTDFGNGLGQIGYNSEI
jgi:hypothetical protein